MTKKTKIIIGVVAAVVVALVIAGVVGYNNYQEYHATYLVIDEVEYRRDTTALDLSGKTITELDKLKELTGLKQLNLRGTGITPEQHDDLQAALPDCEILWSVPFQGGYVDNTLSALTIGTLSEADFAALVYLPNLERINAGGCRDYDALAALAQQQPDLLISYSVELNGTEYYDNQEVLTLTDPDVDELLEKLQYLPDVHTVSLNGTLPENTRLLELKEAYPAITFGWTFDLLGVSVSTLDTFIDLSGVTMENTEALEAALPYFYNLEQIDMVGCGITNKDMDALNKRNPGVKFVWKVSVGGVYIRTDSKYFMPVKYKMKGFGSGSAYNLRYCTDMVAMDFGHYGTVSTLKFLEYMPNLEYLLLCQTSVSDLTSIGTCKNLVFLELFLTRATDFWPLTNLTKLEDLNLSYTPCINGEYGSFGDLTPLYQMTWLDRLWMANSGLGASRRASLQEALPATTFLFFSDGSTNRGWRQAPNYYKQRDIVEMWYMVH